MVRLILSKPEIGGENNGYAEINVGNYGTVNFEGAVGGPIGDNAAYRISFQSTNTDGYWDNRTTGDEQGDREQNAMRFQYLVDPSDDSSLRLEAHYANSEGGQRGIKSHGLFADTGFGGPACVNIDLDDLKIIMC